MATRIEKNTKKLVEKKLDALFSIQQQLNGNAKGSTQGGIPQAADGWDNNWRTKIGAGSPTASYGFQQPAQLDTPYYGANTTGAPLWGYRPPHMLGNVDITAERIRPPYIIPGTGYTPQKSTGGSGRKSSGFNTPMPDNGLGYSAPDELMDIPSDYGSLIDNTPSDMKFSNPKDNPWLPGFKANPAGSNELDWKKVGTFGAQVAPALYNMFRGLQKPTNTKPKYNPYEGNARSLMANRRFNIDPLLEANRTSQAVSNRNISSTANSRGELMANLGAAQNYRMRGDSAAWAQKNNMDNQYMGEQANMDAQLGGQRAQMDWMTQTANEQNRAARNSFLGQGFNDLGKFSQTQQLMANQAKNSQDLTRIFQDSYGGVVGFMPQVQKMIDEWSKTNKA